MATVAPVGRKGEGTRAVRASRKGGKKKKKGFFGGTGIGGSCVSDYIPAPAKKKKKGGRLQSVRSTAVIG